MPTEHTYKQFDAELEAVRARGYDNVIAVSELEAGDVLASGIAGIADYEDVAVCIVEPDAAGRPGEAVP